MPRRDHDPIKVAILGGDPVVGRTLELVLEGAGYDARFLNGSLIDNPAELPEEVRIVLLAPGLHSKGREKFLDRIGRNGTGSAKIPILKLVTASDRALADRPGAVGWPCRVKDLKQQIEAALLKGSRVV